MRFSPFTTPLVTVLFCTKLFCADAPMFRGDLQHSGVYASSSGMNFGRVKWKFQTGGMVFSSPAVSSGVVYVGSTDGNLYAIDLVSGKQQWIFATKSRITSSPAVAHGLVYFVAYDGYLYAVNASDGQLKWKFQSGGERRYTGTHLHGSQPAAGAMPDPFDFYLSSPVVWNGAVLFGSGDGNVYSLNAASGASNWKFKTGDVVHASPAVADGMLFVGSWDTYFYALDATTGREKWRFKTGDDPDLHNQIGIQSSASVVNGMVYFGCRDSNFYALDAKTGQKIWSFSNHGSWVISSPAVTDGTASQGRGGVFHHVYLAAPQRPAVVGLERLFGRHLGAPDGDRFDDIARGAGDAQRTGSARKGAGQDAGRDRICFIHSLA
jgi:eukaryotic-like serine/threonine-protein kinase